MSTILVTGATGTIGSRTVAALGKSGATVRAGVRKPSKPGEVKFEYEDQASIAKALEGVDALFVVTPFSPNQVELGKSLVDAAKNAGVKRVVKLSAAGADVEPGIQLGRWHRAVEKHIEASGLGWTFLRPSNFDQNFINYYPPDAEGAIYLPLGEGKVGWIDAADIGDVAAKVLTTEGHDHKAYELTGPEALSVSEIAAILSSASGRSIRYVDVPEAAARSAMLGLGMPAWMVDAMLELHAISKAGYAAATTDTVEAILGRKPRSFAQFAKDSASAFARKS
jgi:uncharacterized protein YbjT (DUF2867 family)